MMKIATSVLAAAAFAGPIVVAVHRESYHKPDHVSDETRRDLHHVDTINAPVVIDGQPGIQSTTEVLVFEECVGKTEAECLALVNDVFTAHPELLPVGAASASDFLSALEVEKLPVRSPNSADYNYVGLRTDYTDNNIVVGFLGDGMVFYPFDWCTAAGCSPIGPWDCDVGEPLTVQACCDLIQASVPTADVNGNMLECYVDPPYGSEAKPIKQGRLLMHLDGATVVHPPKMM